MGVVSLVLDGYFITGVGPDPSGWFPQSSFGPPYKGYALGSIGISLLAIVIGVVKISPVLIKFYKWLVD
jgi:hypothetical protein